MCLYFLYNILRFPICISCTWYVFLISYIIHSSIVSILIHISYKLYINVLFLVLIIFKVQQNIWLVGNIAVIRYFYVVQLFPLYHIVQGEQHCCQRLVLFVAAPTLYLFAMLEQKLEAAILGCYIVIVHPANFVVDQGGSVSLSEDSNSYCLELGLLPHSQNGKSLQFTLQVPQTVIYFIIELKFSFVLISCLPVTILRNGPTTSLGKQQDGTRQQTSYFGSRVIII